MSNRREGGAEVVERHGRKLGRGRVREASNNVVLYAALGVNLDEVVETVSPLGEPILGGVRTLGDGGG